MSTNIELASKKNADLTQWQWSDKSRQKWEKAEPQVQEFYHQWRSSSETALSQEVHIGHIPGLDRAPAEFIVRDSYKTTFDQIWQLAFENPRTGVVLTGQPGIGKTYFLWYALIRLIKDGQPVAFATNRFVYLFYDNDVWFSNTNGFLFPIAKKVEDFKTEHKPFLFVLIDHDAWNSQPDPGLTLADDVFPVQASSPNPHRFKTWAKVRNAAIWGLPLWDEAELSMAFRLQPEYPVFKASLESILMHSKSADRPEGTVPSIITALDILGKWTEKKNGMLKDLRADGDLREANIKEIEEEDRIYGVDATTIDGALEVLILAAVRDCGPVARDVFEFIFYPRRASAAQATAIDSVTYEDLSNLTKSFRKDSTFPDQTISHRIIMVDPIPDDSIDAYGRPCDQWKIQYRSVKIAREMTQKLEKEKDERLAELYEYFQSWQQASTLASWIHEHISHRTLRKHARQDLVLFKMQGVADDTVDRPVVSVDFQNDIASEERLPGGDRRQIVFQGEGFASLAIDGYYVPAKTNFPLFDSFLVEQREEKLILWIFQMSTSPIHGGSREGYVSIRRIIRSLMNPSGDRDGQVKIDTC